MALVDAILETLLQEQKDVKIFFAFFDILYRPQMTFTQGMKVAVVMVKDGEDIIVTSVVLEESVIVPDLKDIPHATALPMGLLFALNMDYPKELGYTFEVIQRS